MFSIGMQELIIILIIALLVLGPKRLPEVARALGRGVKEFRKATREVKESIDIEGELKKIEDEIISEEIEEKEKAKNGRK
ncbi:MAG TPA: twin-arginine translocase subunit TatB [Candidatus Desulfofervidus auxilii]|uniref:Sec-independent protein translocase protein TatA n=1 Tax=Desulfofervidus auxilii TaxID=1621989 RepID=A0A7C0U4P9_DESA2|nr:Sec-independent protein translocase protein TatB [Candidatus Desulfofervidus auxilii]HDD45473.1 twin-arginine translocase subunit TatB [Candidatus Desulfofervidus auxilii]